MKSGGDYDPLSVEIRQAATLIVVRDADPGTHSSQGLIPGGRSAVDLPTDRCASEVSVLLLQRNLNASFVPGAFVFAGGAIDEADELLVRRHLDPQTPDGDPFGGEAGRAHLAEQAAKITALRECFEEAGLLPGCSVGGQSMAAIPDAVRELRTSVHAGQTSFSDALDAGVIRPILDAMVPFGRWVTPAGPPRRFDTRFFLVRAAADQEAQADGSELISSRWMNPTDALAAADSGELLLIFPTRKTLERLRGLSTVDECLRREGLPRSRF